MSSKVRTYNPKEVVIACGSHIVTGIADDSLSALRPTAMVSPRRWAVMGKSPERCPLTTPTR